MGFHIIARKKAFYRDQGSESWIWSSRSRGPGHGNLGLGPGLIMTAWTKTGSWKIRDSRKNPGSKPGLHIFHILYMIYRSKVFFFPGCVPGWWTSQLLNFRVKFLEIFPVPETEYFPRHSPGPVPTRKIKARRFKPLDRKNPQSLASREKEFWKSSYRSSGLFYSRDYF